MPQPQEQYDPFRLFYLTISVAIVIFASQWVWTVLRPMGLQLMGRDWPTVEGRIISASVQEKDSRVTDPKAQRYLSRIWFSYSVGERKYVARSFRLYDSYVSDKQAIENEVAQYSPYQPVTVFYFKEDPSVAFVEKTDFSLKEQIHVGVGLFLIICGVVAVGDLFNRRRT